jgi:hypothetical protein
MDLTAYKDGKQNCQELLMQANRDIKMLNYKLQRIVSSGNIHQLMTMGQPLEVDLIAE